MTAAILALLGGAVLLALLDWRKGWLALLAVGFLQDAARKVVPGQPVEFVVASAIVFVATAIGTLLANEPPRLVWLFRIFPYLRLPTIFFLLVVGVQTIRTVLTGGGFVLGGLGILSYLSPALAILLAERYCHDLPVTRRYLRTYSLGSLVVGVTVWLAFFGFEPVVFSSIGVDYVYGPGVDGVLRMMSGLMRSSEIAAWHLAAGACWLTAEAVTARNWRWQLGNMIAVAALLVAILLTARRKMFAAYIVFLILFVLLLLWQRGGLGKVARLALGAVFGGAVIFQLLFFFGEIRNVVPYLGRGSTVVIESSERLWSMTIDQFRWVVMENGWFGSGAGTGSQGSQYFGGGADRVGSAAEGGLGKVLAELGVPGLLVLLWLASNLWRAALQVMRLLRLRPAAEAIPILALGAFIPANAAVFFTAHQVFGDPFILIHLGWMLGAIFALPRIWLLEFRGGAQPHLPQRPS